MRLIDAEAFKKQFENECLHNCYYCKLLKWDKKEACSYCGLIDNAPTVESDYEWGYSEGVHDTERPQGEWIEFDRDLVEKIAYCSICKRNVVAKRDEVFSEKYPFCHCGADMRGGEK